MRNGRRQDVDNNATFLNKTGAQSSVERLAVSVAEFAKMFSLSRNQGYSLVKSGQVPVIDFGGRIVIPMKWIREQVDLAKPRNGTPET